MPVVGAAHQVIAIERASEMTDVVQQRGRDQGLRQGVAASWPLAVRAAARLPGRSAPGA